MNVTGQLDWVRSASQPKTIGLDAHVDSRSHATRRCSSYFDHATNNIQHLTTAQLTALYSSSSGTLTINGDTVEACLPLAGSAVRKNAEAAIGVTDSQANTAANAVNCNNLDQNGGNVFYNTVSTPACRHGCSVPVHRGKLDRAGEPEGRGP